MIRIVTLLLSLFCTGGLYAQSYFVDNQYMLNDYIINPALGGLHNNVQVNALHHQKWSGVKGSPHTTMITGDGLMSKKTGLGGVISTDRNGYNAETSIQVGYAYHLNLNKDKTNKFSFGLAPVVRYMSVNTSEIDPGNGIFDPVLSDNNNAFQFNIAGGCNLLLNNLRVSLSASDIMGWNSRMYDYQLEPLRRGRAYGIVSYKIKIPDQKLYIIPEILYRHSFDGNEQEIHSNVWIIKDFNKPKFRSIWAGISYRDFISKTYVYDQALILYGKIMFSDLHFHPDNRPKFWLENWWIGYGLRLELSQWQKLNTGSHTIAIGIVFPHKPPKCKVEHYNMLPY